MSAIRGATRHAAAALPILGLLFVVAALPAASPQRGGEGVGDAVAGRASFQVCTACHTVERGGPALVGPNLHGVVGRDIASQEGFHYSDALTALGGSWEATELDRFLADPMRFAPGTRMGMPGVADARERANLIAYLESLDGDAAANAGAPPADFGDGWPPGPGQVEAGRLCNSCHSLAIVKQQGLPRETWDELLDWMVEEQGMARQTPEQRALILDYLAENFGIPD